MRRPQTDWKHGRSGSHDDRSFRDKPFSTVTDGLKPKDLVGMAWRVAFALQADGWWLRSDIVWHKPNPMPESVRDRPTRSHEFLFLLTKSERYWYDADAIREPASLNTHARRKDGAAPPKSTAFDGDDQRNKRDVWTIATEPYPDAHFATFPEALVEPCILAGCPEGGLVLDPFCGTGTVLAVTERLGSGRRSLGIELSADHCRQAERRVGHQQRLAI